MFLSFIQCTFIANDSCGWGPQIHFCVSSQRVVSMMIWCDRSVSVSSSPGARVCEDRWHEDRSGGHGHRWHAGALRSVSPHTSTSTNALFSPHLKPSQPLALLSRRLAILVLFAQQAVPTILLFSFFLAYSQRDGLELFVVCLILVLLRSEIHIHGQRLLYFMKSFNRQKDIQNIRNQNLVRNTFLKMCLFFNKLYPRLVFVLY